MSEVNETALAGDTGGNLLPRDSDRPRADLRMIAKAVREGWGVRKELKDQLIERMAEIVQTKAVPVPDSMGNVHDRVDVANNHAIAAARVLAAVDQVDQDDYWNADKNTRLDEGKSTENVQFAAGVINRLPLPESLSDGK